VKPQFGPSQFNSPALPKYVTAAFGSLDRPWKPGYLRSAYGAICCHRFKPKNMTDDMFLAQILGHKKRCRNAEKYDAKEQC
jgi:hypothetical protein